MRALLAITAASVALRRSEIIPGFREASVWSHDGKRVVPTSAPAVTGCRFIYPECEKVCVNNSYVLENTTLEVTSLGQTTCYLTLTNESKADELFSPSLFPSRLQVVDCPETVCDYNAGQYLPKVHVKTVPAKDGETLEKVIKAPAQCKTKYPACAGSCTEKKTVRKRGYENVEESFTKNGTVYEIGFACWKAVEDCTVDRCLKWPQAWTAMKNVDCPSDGECVFVQDCIEVVVNGKMTQKCTGEETEAGASQADSEAGDGKSSPSQEAPWRPFETRFMAGRKCYGADWAIRQATDPDAIRADCEPLGQEECEKSSSCLSRTDSPVWYYRMRQKQSDAAHPYLRTHDNPPAGLVHPEPDSTVLRARHG
jgi:hypothetical protein